MNQITSDVPNELPEYEQTGRVADQPARAHTTRVGTMKGLRCGLPLGGIGTGAIQILPDGTFDNLSAQNNWDRVLAGRKALGICDGPERRPLTEAADMRGLGGAFLALHVRSRGLKLICCAEPENPFYLPEDRLHFQGRFPIAELRAQPWDDVTVTVTAFSPFALWQPGPHCRDAAFPGVQFAVQVENRGTENLAVQAVLCWPNKVGFGGGHTLTVADRTGNTIENLDAAPLRGLRFYSTAPKAEPRTQGEWVLLSAGPEVSTLVCDTGCDHDKLIERIAADLDAQGRLRFHSPFRSICPHEFGAVASGDVLPAAGRLEIPFTLAWYFPDITDLEARPTTYRNSYTRHWQSALAVATELNHRRDELLRKSRDWHDVLDAGALPAWMTQELINSLATLPTNALYTADGRFSTNESPSEMAGCMGTIDQRSVADAAVTLFFPELGRQELDIFSAQQITADHPDRRVSHWNTQNGRFDRVVDLLGAIRHDVGWEGLSGGYLGTPGWRSICWPDLAPVYVIQVVRQAQWTGDRAWLERTLPHLRAALAYMRTLDTDGDGIAELFGPGSSTLDSHDFPNYGASPFIATLQIAALQAAGKVAQWLGDTAWAAELADQIQHIQSSLEKNLWDATRSHYLAWRDPSWANWADGERAHAEMNPACSAYQVAGQFFADQLGTGPVVPPKRLTAVLTNIARRNARQVPGAIASDVNDAGAYTVSWPLYAQCYFAAVALRAGVETETALASVRKIYDLKTAAGLDWFFPITFGGKDNAEPGWGRWYMSAPSMWYVAAALSGVVLDRMAGTLTISPAFRAALMDKKPLPVFFPGLWCSLLAEGDQVVLRVDRIAEEIPLRQAVLEGTTRVARNIVLRSPGDEIRL